MKKVTLFSLLAAMAVTLTGCFVYERKPARAVVVEDGPYVNRTVITTLPTGYRTRIYRGTTYYYNRDVVYRAHPRGGYTVVTRPW